MGMSISSPVSGWTSLEAAFDTVHPTELSGVAGRAQLAQPVTLHYRATQTLGDGVAEIGIQRGRTGHDAVQGRQVVVIDHRMFGQRNGDRRRDERDRSFGDIGRMIEELRVSLWAQQLGTARPVSEQRIYRAIDAV